MSSEGIFLVEGEDGYEYCHPTSSADFETLNREINGRPHGDEWTPVPVELVQNDGKQSLMRSDSPWLGDHALIFKAEAVVALRGLLGSAGELLPLACREARLFVFNPFRALAALDESASSLVRFDDGRVMMVKKYAFVTDLVKGIDAFKLTNLRVSPTFVSKRIVDAWHQHGLNGLRFRQVG